MAEATFQPAAAPGSSVEAAARGIEQGQSMMMRASQLRQAQQMEQMRAQQMAEQVIMAPLRNAEMQTKLVKMRTDYESAMNMQESMKSVNQMVGKAREDFNFVNQIENAEARAKASVEWLSRYSQIANFKEYENEFNNFSKLAAKNVAGWATIGGAEEQFFNRLTTGLTPEEKAQAVRVKSGVGARPSGAAIQYKEVIGPDGTPRLVAVDPRSVGAQVVGTGQTYGSGVNPTQESEAAAQGQVSASPTVFQGQTAYDKSRDTTAGKEDAERVSKLRQDKPKRQLALRQAEAAATRLVDDIDDLIGKVNVSTAGPGGVILDKFPGTTARDFETNLNSIKATIGFQALQAMREASPTGGALGQVSDAENRLLQSQLGALEVGQSPKQLIENLKKVRQRVQGNFGITRAAFDNQFGDVEDVAPTWDEAKEKRLLELKAKLGK